MKQVKMAVSQNAFYGFSMGRRSKQGQPCWIDK
jgi:hypothetical protein